MPLALIAVSLLLIVSAVKGTERELGTQIASEFSGSGNFLQWLGAIAVLGGLGVVPGLREPTRWLIALVLVVMFLSHSGVVAQAFAAVRTAQPAAPIAPPPETPAAPASSSSSSGGGDVAGNVIGDVAKALPLLAFL